MSRLGFAAALAVAALACGTAAAQSHYLYVWTAGVDGQGDGSDKLVTLDAKRASDRYGKVVHTLSVGGRGELVALVLSDDGRSLRAVREGRVFEFDVGADPSRPRMRRAGAAPVAAIAAGPAREARDPGRLFVAGVQLRNDPDPAHFVRAYRREGGELTIAFETDFRAPRLGLPRALVLLSRPAAR
jgi:selenium-binding protein 1